MLVARPFAHRGLHGGGTSENGMAAFDAAIAAGFGIECDVRASRDGIAFVFHDALLARMTGDDRATGDCSAAELDALRLPDGGPIPRFDALLDRCAQTPLLVEIKTQGRHVAAPCQAVAAVLDRHPAGPFAIMAFNPLAVRWFARHRPSVRRGLVTSGHMAGKGHGPIAQALALWLAKPDFLACDIRDLPSPLASHARRRGMPVLTWTVRIDAERTGVERRGAAVHADQIIFETSAAGAAHD